MIKIFNVLDFCWELCRKPKSVPITDTPIITFDEIDVLLSKLGGQLWIGDGIYKLINSRDIKLFLDSNPVNKRKYITDFHDCDDYCYELMGDVSTWNPEGSFGMVWGNRTDGVAHAWNCFINENKELWFVEPQTDAIFKPTTEKIWVILI